MIAYSHVNEDINPEHLSMAEMSPTDLFCIAGSGERLIGLLDIEGLERVHIIDSNLEALHLTRLKLTALKHMSVSEYLGFIGHYLMQHEHRLTLYRQHRSNLQAECRKYWDNRLNLIGRGVLNCGAFEHFLAISRPLVQPFIGRFFDNLLDSSIDQTSDVSSIGWALVKWIFSKKWAYRILGNKDIAFVAPDANVKRIPDAIQQTITEGIAANSFINHLIVKGNLLSMSPKGLPRSLHEGTLSNIVEKLRSGDIELIWYHNDLLEALNSINVGSETTTFYSFSDILSFVGIEYLLRCLEMIAERPSKESAIVVRSFLRLPLKEHVDSIRIRNYNITDISNMDRTRMYDVFKLYLS